MKSFLNDQTKILDKSNNISRNNLPKKLRNLKLITEYSQKRKYQNENMKLKFRNSFKYDINNINNILNRTNSSSKNKIKKRERNYSSFYSKTASNFFDSDNFPPNLNRQDKAKTKKLYTRIFSSDTNYTDNRIESFNIKSNRTRNYSSYRTKNIKGLNLDLNYSDLKFNNDTYNQLLKNKKKESLSFFLEKSKIVRKQKIINHYLENKYKYEKDIMEEKMNKIQMRNIVNKKNLFLMKQFSIAHDKYLGKINIKKMKERQINNELKDKKLKLENDINRLKNKLDQIKSKLFKLIDIKEFIIFVQNSGFEKIKASDKSNILLLKQNLEERVNLIYNQILEKYNKNKNDKNVIRNFKRNDSLSKSLARRTTKKIIYNKKSINKNNKKLKRLSPIYNIPSNSLNKISKNKLKIENKNNNSEDLNDFKNNFNKFEIIVLNNLEYLTTKRNEIRELKKNLTDFQLDENVNKQILDKIKILNNEKNKYKTLKTQKNLIQYNFSKNQNINKNLHKQLYNILLDINENVSGIKKTEVKNILKILNMEMRKYSKKRSISKTLYIIKSLESLYLFYHELIERFRENKDNEKLYQEKLEFYKHEKDNKAMITARNKIEEEKIEKQNKVIKKYSKIYITSHMKYNMKLFLRNKKNKIKKQSSEHNNDSLEQLLTYY